MVKRLTLTTSRKDSCTVFDGSIIIRLIKPIKKGYMSKSPKLKSPKLKSPSLKSPKLKSPRP